VTEKRHLTVALAALDVQLGTPVLNLCAQKKWQTMKYEVLSGFPRKSWN
jgi:hypothetical protein